MIRSATCSPTCAHLSSSWLHVYMCVHLPTTAPAMQGYSVGAWTALLAAHGFDVTTVHVLSWKKDLGLLKRNKDSSRQLAKVLFQQAGVPQDELLR